MSNYSREGHYFITTCAKDRECLFGEIIDGSMKLNEYGRIVEVCWFDLPNHYSNIRLDAFCIMPNHIHGIILIDNNIDVIVVGKGLKPETGLKPVSTNPVFTKPFCTSETTTKKHHGLSEFVRALKTFSSRRINEIRCGNSVWQPGFHDHVIRNYESLERIRGYINNNSKNWHKDKFRH